MKKLYILICLMLISVVSIAQWTVCTTSGTTANIHSVYFADNNHGYVAGLGMYRWGTDCNWIGMGNSYDIYYSVFFTSADTGYMVGGTNYPFGNNYGVVVKTTSGGSGFSGNLTYTIDTLMSVYFTSSSIGYATGQDGLIQKTTDGANNWTTLTSGTANNLWSVCFPAINTGYVAGLFCVPPLVLANLYAKPSGHNFIIKFSFLRYKIEPFASVRCAQFVI
jgi:hypothetical protein